MKNVHFDNMKNYTVSVRKTLWLIGTLIPPLLLLWLICRFHIDVPFADQWDLVPLFDKFYAGRLSFHDLFAQHK